MGIHRVDGDTARGIHTRKCVVNTCMPARGAELGRWGGGGRTGHLSREVALQTDEFDLETQHGQAMLSDIFSKHCLNTGIGCGRQKAEMAPQIPLVLVYVLQLFNPSLF